MKKFVRFAVVFFTLAFSTQSMASLMDFNPAPANADGSQVVYEVDGTFWGLIGLSGGANNFLSAPADSSDSLLAALNESIVSGSVLGFYLANPFGDGAFAEGSAGDALTGSNYIASLSANDRLWDSIWVNFTGGNVVFARFNSSGEMAGGRNTLAGSATMQGSPFPTATVPESSAIWLFSLGLAVLFGRKFMSK